MNPIAKIYERILFNNFTKELVKANDSSLLKLFGSNSVILKCELGLFVNS